MQNNSDNAQASAMQYDSEDIHAFVHHVTPRSVYYVVFLLLMVLTALTTAVAFVDLGWAGTPVAMLIAITKGTLVVLFFMHVRYSPRLIWVILIGALLWMGVLFVLTYADYFSRSWRFF